MAYTCHETTLQNVSGGSLIVSMFRTGVLDDGETFTIHGTPGGWINANFNGIKRRRMLDTFNRLIEDDQLAIVSLPSAPCGNDFQYSSSSDAAVEESSSSSSFAG